MGHNGAFSGAGLPLPIRQVFTNCGDVCLVLYDSRHDGGPAPCHLLPLAGLPCWGDVPLEHPGHGGLGPGTSAQLTSGREGWTSTQLTKTTHGEIGLKSVFTPLFLQGAAQDVALFLAC